MKEVDGWGPLNSHEVLWRCDCGRWKRETIDLDTGETLRRSPEYGGGLLLRIGEVGQIGGMGQRAAKLEWLRRGVERSRRAAVAGVTKLDTRMRSSV
jgi:hypothetical protein